MSFFGDLQWFTYTHKPMRYMPVLASSTTISGSIMVILEEALTVLKYSSPEAPKASAICLVVTTQDIG